MNVNLPLLRNRTDQNDGALEEEIGRPNDAPTPAEQPNPDTPVELNILGEGVEGLNTNRYITILTTAMSIPQILAGIVILFISWNDQTNCASEYIVQWKVWSIIQLVLITLHTVMRIVGWRAEEARGTLSHALNTVKNALEALGLIWFVTGNLWLFGGQTESCAEASQSPIYQLCLALIIILYIQLCLPCILAVMMVPLLCFCLPCVVRLLSFLNDPSSRKGASQETINSIPLVKYGDVTATNHPEGVIVDSSCSICFVDYLIGDELRNLHCGHALHKSCIDSWLVISSTCPICRSTISTSQIRRQRSSNYSSLDNNASTNV
mmetsp:Transcript_4149/g.6331  ORF Transcript_4149/g.6331 Transcript_4149/m.6331 type:complete len:322 (-) Transcript_4149:265-1230(-)